MENEGGRMRELKFRAWVKNYNCYADVLGFEQGKLFVQFQSGERAQHRLYVPIEDSAIEQYTGLKDKNGKEIYEGDIVEYDWYIVSDKPAYRTKEQVTFDDMGARLGNDRIRNCSNVEVIGNIHENPDLLEKK